MVRNFTIPLLAAVFLLNAGIAQAGGKAEKDIKITGKLTKDDPKDTKRNFACNVHIIKMKAGSVYTIDMVTKEFDAYLRLEDANRKELAEDDDSGGDLNARIIFNCTVDGDYRVICTCFAEATGNYTLTIKKNVTTQPSGTPHALLVDKPAPDFHGDFAINGKPLSLTDLKGKVVLLDFWTAQSASCAAIYPRLREWHKAHKAEGLVVVGVTYFNSEHGQKFGFDAATGKVKHVDTANRASDQAMLKEFASHFKLDYLLLALSKDNAQRTFEAYGVNGVPQVVLIDRNGIIRLIRTGDLEVNAVGGAVETNLKKLLAEK